MTQTAIDIMPGYRRRIRLKAGKGAVAAVLEDDMHCMAVTLRHDGTTVTEVIPDSHRAPWTTCPGAQAKLVETFTGLPLAEVTARQAKKQNCTHLHDLAVLAAAHAMDAEEVSYDLLVSDPVGNERILEIRRNGAIIHRWTEQAGKLAAPAEVAGQTLFSLRDWIAGLPEPDQEAARLLQWGSIVAHGRTLPIERQSVATAIPPNCYTFQPDRAVHAIRNGISHDFSKGSRMPLDGFGDRVLSAL